MPNDCPAWCAGDHGPLAGDGPARADFVHSTSPNPIPVITMTSLPDGIGVVEAEIVDVVLFQYPLASHGPGDRRSGEEWVFIGSDGAALTLTRESARRLYRALGTVLAS